MVIFAKVRGIPKPEIAWFRDGKPLKSGDYRYNIFEKEDCNYFEIDRIWYGLNYGCVAKNISGAPVTC